MGYITKDVANIDEPKVLSLSGEPNFVTFTSKPGAKTYLDVDLQILLGQATPDLLVKSILRATDPEGNVFEFHGTTDPDEVGGTVFYVAADPAETAENLREAMRANRWLDANFEMRIAATWNGAAVTNGDTINIRGKSAGASFVLGLTAPGNPGAYAITWNSATSVSGDTIAGEAATVEIELDVYEGAAVTLGGDDRPTDEAKIGTFAVSLQKTYAHAPIWFDVNALYGRYGGYNLPAAAGWFNTGTARVTRFVAKVKGYTSAPFYMSNALFVINGRGDQDLADFAGGARLLTNKPRTALVRGQVEYLNYLHSGEVYPVEVLFRAYTAANIYLGAVTAHPLAQPATVNTCALDFTQVLDAYPSAAVVRVALTREGAVASNDLEYEVLPECLHDLRQFHFLNALGGWDTFNFDAGLRNDVKREAETYSRTRTPSLDPRESVSPTYDARVTDEYTVEGAPVRDEVAVWLKELAEARVVLDGQGRAVNVIDINFSITEEARDMQTPVIKYSYD